MEIFISRDGQQFGPYPVEQVRELLNQGILQANDLAWHEGLEGWISLGELTASAPGGPPPPIPEQPEPAMAAAPAKAGGNIKLFIGLGAAMAVLAIAAGAWLLLAPKKEQLAGSDPKPNAPASQNPKGKAPTAKLTPEEAAEVMAWEIGTWESQGEGQPAGGRPNPIAMTKEVRWKEEGKSLEYKFSLVENGKPVTYFGHQEYDAAMGVFVYRSKWGNNPETTSHEVHDITTGISRGISVPTPTNGEPSTTVLNKRVGDDQSEQTLETSLNGQVLYSHQITSTRINTAPTEPTLLGKKIIGKRFILEADRDEDTKQKVILQFRENGIFEVAQIRDGEVRPDSDEMTFKINGLKARVFENGKEDGGITFNSDNPAIGDLVTFGSARRQTAGTILSIEPAKPLSQTAHAESKPGTVLWEFETGDAVYSSPAIGSDGTVYVGSVDNKLYAINGKTGVKLWEFETGDYVTSSPAIGSDGTVYVGAEDKKLYAIKTDSKGLAKSPWPMRGQNPQHTGRALKTNTVSAKPKLTQKQILQFFNEVMLGEWTGVDKDTGEVVEKFTMVWHEKHKSVKANFTIFEEGKITDQQNTSITTYDPKLDLFVEKAAAKNGQPESIKHFHWNPIDQIMTAEVIKPKPEPGTDVKLNWKKTAPNTWNFNIQVFKEGEKVFSQQIIQTRKAVPVEK